MKTNAATMATMMTTEAMESSNPHHQILEGSAHQRHRHHHHRLHHNIDTVNPGWMAMTGTVIAWEGRTWTADEAADIQTETVAAEEVMHNARNTETHEMVEVAEVQTTTIGVRAVGEVMHVRSIETHEMHEAAEVQTTTETMAAEEVLHNGGSMRCSQILIQIHHHRIDTRETDQVAAKEGKQERRSLGREDVLKGSLTTNHHRTSLKVRVRRALWTGRARLL
jgi:hypothetical protein